jgi:hypothetical protein
VEVSIVHPTARTTRTIPADTVVMIGYNQPNRELADYLLEEGVTTHVVGDAAGTSDLRSAIRSSSLLGRSL